MKLRASVTALIAFVAWANASSASADCPRNRGAEVIGGLLGRVIGPHIPGIGTYTMRELLTEGISCMLTDNEKRKAADATRKVAGAPPGTKEGWTSDDRPGVSGTSESTGENTTADGTVCTTVRDVVIVNGEETTETKTLCKPPGATGFTRSA
jgi:surface antigen